MFHFLHAIFAITVINIILLIYLTYWQFNSHLAMAGIAANAVVLADFLNYYYKDHQSADGQLMIKEISFNEFSEN